MDAVIYLPYVALKNNQCMNLAMSKSLDNDGKYITLSLNLLYGNCMAIASNRAIEMHGKCMAKASFGASTQRMANASARAIATAWQIYHSKV